MYQRAQSRRPSLGLARAGMLAGLAVAGCAVGGPQIGPRTASGYHTTTQFHFVSGNAELGGTGYSETQKF